MVLMDTDWCMSYNTLLQIRTHFSTNLCILNWHHSNFSTKSMVGVGMPWIGVPTTAQYVDTDLCPNVRWSFKKSDFFFFLEPPHFLQNNNNVSISIFAQNDLVWWKLDVLDLLVVGRDDNGHFGPKIFEIGLLFTVLWSLWSKSQ